MSFTSDWLYPPYQSKEVVDILLKQKKDVTYLNINSSFGHDAFLLEFEALEKVICRFLSATYRKNYGLTGDLQLCKRR